MALTKGEQDFPGFVGVNEYLTLKHDPNTWLIKNLIPVSGAALIFGSPKTGKAGYINTPVLTPTGWTTLGEVHPGDLVYGSNGQPTEVLAESVVWENRPCLEVTFTDGQSVIVDEEHEWEVTKAGKQCPFCNPPKIVTTKQMLKEGVTRSATRKLNPKYNSRKYMWHVKLPKPIEFPLLQKSLLIDPYCLGSWLGDGASSCAQITIGDRDAKETIALWAEAGWELGKINAKYQYAIRKDGQKGAFITLIRQLGLHNNKHIPSEYLYASISQRKALLQGLLDSDGYAKGGVCYFYNMNKQLANQVCELAISLGAKVKLGSKQATLNGKSHGTCYIITIRAEFNPFRLSFKKDQFILNTECYQAIISIKPVLSVPVKCIQVSAPDHLYLLGKTCLPTHNSALAIQLALALTGTDDDWLGFPIVTHGKVLYLQLDCPRSTWRLRFEALKKHGIKINDENFLLADRESLAHYPYDILKILPHDHMLYLHSLVQYHNPVAVVIDTLRKVHSGDEDKSTIMSNVVSRLIGACHPAALILISHSRKPSPDGDFDLMAEHRGSGSVTGEMDAILKLTKSSLYFAGRNIEDGNIKLERQDADHVLLWKVRTDADMEKHLLRVLNDSTLPSMRSKAKVLAPLISKSEDGCMSIIRRRLAGKTDLSKSLAKTSENLTQQSDTPPKTESNPVEATT
jgi:hypothetical protein